MSGSSSKRYPAELRERAVRMVIEIRAERESEWAAMGRVAQLLGVGTPETVRKWCRQAEVNAGQRVGLTSENSAEMKRLKRENAELKRATSQLVVDAVDQAVWTRQRDGRDLTGLIAQHDHGVQYLSVAYSERLDTAGIKPSTGAVGSSYDNALAETINGLYKTELIKPRRPWKGFDDLELATAEWVNWFNHRRPLEYCDDLAPIEAEHAHYRHHQTPATAGVSS